MNREGLEFFETDFELAEYLQNLLTAHATGGSGDEFHYKFIRTHFLENTSTKNLVPVWVRTNRDLSQFWEFIKHKFAHASVLETLSNGNAFGRFFTARGLLFLFCNPIAFEEIALNNAAR